MLSVEEIKNFIDSDNTSEKKQLARLGNRYYEGEHDMLNYRLFYYDADGVLKEDKYRTNVKICHPFFTEIVDQQVQYMLSSPDNPIRSDIPELQTELDKYFDDAFWAEVGDVLTGCVSKGFDYLYAYMSNEDRLKFQYADSLGVVEVRAKDTDDKCAYVIYWYVDRIDKGRKVIKRIQVWDSVNVWYYVQTEEGVIKLDENEKLNPKPHVIKIDDKGDRYGSSLGFIPFFRLDNNRKQFSGLKPIKALIDDYDMMCCGLSNNITDAAESLIVVKGFQGDNLEELIQNVKTKKHIGVDDNGGIETHTVDIPHEARLKKAELDEKNIYRFGMAFNSTMVGDGNITNIVIKSRYALLDLKANKLEKKLKAFLRQIIKIVLDEINNANETDYQMKDVYFEFEREIMTNAADNAEIENKDAQTKQVMINTLLNLQGHIDDETIIQNICDILEIDYEEIKGKLPDPEETENEVKDDLSALDGVTPDE